MLTLATKAAQAAAVQVVTVGAAQVVAVATAVLAWKALTATYPFSRSVTTCRAHHERRLPRSGESHCVNDHHEKCD